jgi:hypothetical protein
MSSEHKRKHADAELAEATGKPVSEFSAEEYEIPDPEELETVPADEE